MKNIYSSFFLVAISMTLLGCVSYQSGQKPPTTIIKKTSTPDNTTTTTTVTKS